MEQSNLKRYYAGIGSRQTPFKICNLMSELSNKLETEGLILRSGGAIGADKAFELGVSEPEHKEIYTISTELNEQGLRELIFYLNQEEIGISEIVWSSVKKYHPYSHKLTPYIYGLMARNYYQVMGYKECEEYEDNKLIIIIKECPSLFILCWTKDGCNSHHTRSYLTGGTGQAISIASDNNIPIYNLQRTEDYNLWLSYLNNEILLSDIIT